MASSTPCFGGRGGDRGQPQGSTAYRRARRRGPDHASAAAVSNGDLDATYLVIAATDDRRLNARVVTEAREAGILTQAVDDIPYCDFFAMAIVRRAISSSASRPTGAAPPSPAGCGSDWTPSFRGIRRSAGGPRRRPGHPQGRGPIPSTKPGRRRSPTTSSLPWAPAIARRPGAHLRARLTVDSAAEWGGAHERSGRVSIVGAVPAIPS